MVNKRIIFVNGHYYSGSTLLSLMLANHPNGFSLGESHHIFEDTGIDEWRLKCRCFQPDCELWNDLKEAGACNFYERIFEKFSDVEWITDSSGDKWCRKQLSRSSVPITVTNVYKYPDKWIQSANRRNRGMEGTLNNWFKINIRLLSIKESVHEFYVNCHRLQSSPEQALETICEKLNITFRKEQVKFWTGVHHIIGGSDSAVLHLAEKGSEAYRHVKSALLTNRESSTALNHYREIYQAESNLESIHSKLPIKLPYHPSYDLYRYFESKRTNKTVTNLNFKIDNFLKNYFRSLPDNYALFNENSFSYVSDFLKKIDVKLSERKNQVLSWITGHNLPPGRARTLYRRLARVFKKEGFSSISVQLFKRALDIEDGDSRAIGDWYHLARMREEDLRETAIYKLRLLKPELIPD